MTRAGASAKTSRTSRRRPPAPFDYLSVEKFGSEGFETHMALLSSGVVIVEGLDLRAVAAGVYELICLPLKIAAGSGDGAPARAILRALD
jgi:arylformamidase